MVACLPPPCKNTVRVCRKGLERRVSLASSTVSAVECSSPSCFPKVSYLNFRWCWHLFVLVVRSAPFSPNFLVLRLRSALSFDVARFMLFWSPLSPLCCNHVTLRGRGRSLYNSSSENKSGQSSWQIRLRNKDKVASRRAHPSHRRCLPSMPSRNQSRRSRRCTRPSTWCRSTLEVGIRAQSDTFRAWIAFSGGVILFNKYLLDTMGFSESPVAGHYTLRANKLDRISYDVPQPHCDDC